MITLQTKKEQDFKSLENMLHQLVNRFAKKHGGDPDELFSEACVAYCKAYERFDASRGKLTTLIYTSVWNHLITYRTRETKHQDYQFGQSEDTDVNQVPDEFISPFNLTEFVEGLGRDAATVVRLLFFSPMKMEVDAKQRGGHIKNWAAALRKTLKKLDWTSNQIKEAFEEVKGALG